MSYILLDREALDHGTESDLFEGYRHGGAGISAIIVHMAPGKGPRLHQHPYEEVFIMQEGSATFTVGAETLEAHAGHVIVVPANTPHKFKNTGAGYLRQVDIHVSERFITEWLEP